MFVQQGKHSDCMYCCGWYIKGELNAKTNLFLFESIGKVD